MPAHESYAMRIRSLIGVVAAALLLTLAQPGFANDKDQNSDLTIVEETIPDTLHPNDFALTPVDRAITARVRATLVTAPFLPIDADAIAVQTRHGQVTLRGSVRSRALKQEINLRTPLIPGVEAVDNQLTIQSKSDRDR